MKKLIQNSSWKRSNRQFVFKGGIALSIGILFYNSLIAGGVFLLVCLCVDRKKQKHRTNGDFEEGQKEFRLQFKDALQSVSTSLEAGYSVENAWRQTQKELLLLYPPDADIVREFEIMLHQLNNNKTMEEILNEFAGRRKLEEVESFATVFTTAKRTGGDIIRITRMASETIQRRLEALQEIETLLAGKKYEAGFMKMVPSVILIYFRLFSPGYLDIFYGSVGGILFMTFLLAVNLAAALWASQIAAIEI